MKYRALDANGDYTFGRRLFLFNREAVAQAIVTRMRLLYGEWWEDISDGLPLFERILGASGSDESRQAVCLLISERIQGTQGILRMLRFESTFDPNTRHYAASCTIDTVFGEINVYTADTFQNVEVSF